MIHPNPLNSLSRRDVLKLTAAGVAGASLSGWLNVLAARAAESGAKHKACILLWMDGGPSHKDTFDMKPGTKDAGDFSPIKTAAPALCPDVTYDDLEEIADGGAASTAFWSMASGRVDAETSERLRRSLREYCHRDTWAMVRLHQALDALAAPSH